MHPSEEQSRHCGALEDECYLVCVCVCVFYLLMMLGTRPSSSNMLDKFSAIEQHSGLGGGIFRTQD